MAASKEEEKNITQAIENAIVGEQNTVPYNPLSKCPPLATVTPLALYGETYEALKDLAEQVGSIDDFLVEKLKYTSRLALCNAFSAEQADAVALMIYQIEKGFGFILGDFTGLGKGRCLSGIMRYAYINNKIPIFITEKPNLFSDNYRDIKDIGGLSTKDGRPVMPKPLILNGYKSGGYAYEVNSKGETVRIKKPSETSIIDEFSKKEVVVAPDRTEINKIISGKILPKQFGYIVLTYSQLSDKNSKPRQDYLSRLAPNAIFIADECHNAAGSSSQTGVFFQEVLPKAAGAVFSSATFAKRANNMYLYATKTSIQESAIGVTKLLEAIAAGGNKLLEYLASNLVKAGQMIRRERSYDNCEVNYMYMPDNTKQAVYEKYDNAIIHYGKLIEFTTTQLFRDARKKAIERFAKKNKVELAVGSPDSGSKKDVEKWTKENEGKYKVRRYTAGEIKSTRFNFIETLLFALKADFVADQAISQLTDNLLRTKDMEGGEVVSARKPIIAVRNTLESVYETLGVQVGDTMPMADFSLYIQAIAKNLLSGAIELNKIRFKEKDDEEEEDDKIRDAEHFIIMDDFEDKGKTYNDMVDEAGKVVLDLPLNPIDHIIQRIESVRRPSGNRYGGGSEYFRVGEITGRKYNLFRQPDGKYKLTTNRKDKNKYVTFQNYNNGVDDVILINESGSTGGSAHSSPKFNDTRPRTMVIHQIELDVNTEVQKRGRIFRTGQLYYPTYTYAVSRVPSEIRRLLMLKRKLRSLDANTTANQKQSSKMVEIVDNKGNPIEDIYNEYGAEVLGQFLEEPANFIYVKYDKAWQDLNSTRDYLTSDKTERINSFCRELELAPSYQQEFFYDAINQKYIDFVNNLKEAGLYDLETETEDLKASIKNRVVITKNTNTSPFTYSVYEEDDYVLQTSKPYTKEQRDNLIKELCQGKRPDDWHSDFKKEFDRYYKEEYRPQIKTFVKEPDYTLAKDKAEAAEWKADYLQKISDLEKREDEIHEYMKNIFAILKPGTAVMIPDNIDDLADDQTIPSGWINGMFCGYKIHDNLSRNKYTGGNIDLIFAQLEGKKRIVLKPTPSNEQALQWVIAKIPEIDRWRYSIINNWEVDIHKRSLGRFLTGNILDAYSIASVRIVTEEDVWQRRIKFTKFTTVDGSAIRFGLRLSYKETNRYKEITPETAKLSLPLNHKDFYDHMKESEYEIPFGDEGKGETLLLEPRSDYFILKIFGGIYSRSGSSPEDKQKRGSYHSKYYSDIELLNLSDRNWAESYTRYTPKGNSKNRLLNVKWMSFTYDKKDQMAEFDKIRQYIFAKDNTWISFFAAGGASAIHGEKDVYDKDATESGQKEVGDYYYYLLSPYESQKDKLSKFSKFVEYEKDSNYTYGKIKTNYRLSPVEAMSYFVAPINHTVPQMVRDTYSLFSDDEKIEMTTEIKKMVEAGTAVNKIGLYVYDKLYKGKKVVTVETLYGRSKSIAAIGEIFKSFVEKGESAEAPPPEKQEKQQEAAEPVELNMDSAQDYLILMNY